MDGVLAINTAEILAELKQLREEQQAVRLLLEKLSRDLGRSLIGPLPPAKTKRVSASADDRARIASLLPAIRATIKDRTFTVAELVKVYATRHTTLRATLKENGLSSKQIGKLFARFQGENIDGWQVAQPGKREAGGRVWQVVNALGKAEKDTNTCSIGLSRERSIP